MVVNKDKIRKYLDEGTLEYNMMFNYLYEVDVSLSPDRNKLVIVFPSLVTQVYSDFVESVDLATLSTFDQLNSVIKNKIYGFATIVTIRIVIYFYERYGIMFDIRAFKELEEDNSDDETALNDLCKGIVRTIEICMSTDEFKQFLHTVGLAYMAFFSSMWKDINNITLSSMNGKLTRMRIQTAKVGSVYYIPNMKEFMDDK